MRPESFGLAVVVVHPNRRFVFLILDFFCRQELRHTLEVVRRLDHALHAMVLLRLHLRGERFRRRHAPYCNAEKAMAETSGVETQPDQ